MGVLEVQQLNVRFGEHHAVRDVDLVVDEGSVVGLIGPNGAGKTTAFNAICGVQRCAGTVTLDGVDISSAPAYRRAHLGINRTFQRLEIFGSMSALENVRTAADIAAPTQGRSRRQSMSRAEEIVDLLGLGDVAGRRADALPTGQARLVELGRALATEPRVLLLDEPASGLDDVETGRLADVIGGLRDGGMAVLMVEHDIDLVMQLCSRVYVLNLGVVIASGTAEEVRNDPIVRDAYLGSAV